MKLEDIQNNAAIRGIKVQRIRADMDRAMATASIIYGSRFSASRTSA